MDGLIASTEGQEIIRHKANVVAKAKDWKLSHNWKWAGDARKVLKNQGKERDISASYWNVFRYRIRTLDEDIFKAFCTVLELDWKKVYDPNPIQQNAYPVDFSAYDNAWVGRESLIKDLSERVRGACRILILVGITGIGKTALAERLAVKLEDWFQKDWKNNFQRANFDYEGKPRDFVSVAARWLEEWGEEVLPEERRPELLLYRLVEHLRKNRVLVLIDSLERLLKESEDGWGDFADEWWEKFFLHLLSAESCQSRLIVTSQDLPVKLVKHRYENRWYREILYGLDESEQEALFKKTGLYVSQEPEDRHLLMRIGKAYKGHPLVLRVIIGEIWEDCNGNVQEFWNSVGSKIEEVEKALAEAEQGKDWGEDDEWKLHQLTSRVNERVNKEYLEGVFERLKKQVKDAYLLLCAASVYRRPVQQEGWLMQLEGLVKDFEPQECSQERQDRALKELCNRFLAEISRNHNNKRVLGQHNLVRSVALEHHKTVVAKLKS